MVRPIENLQMMKPDTHALGLNEAEEITLRLAESVAQESVLVLNHSGNLIDELSGLEKSKRTFDLIIVDCTESGFLFPTEILTEASTIIKSLLNVPGSLVFAKRDKAMALVKESAAGSLSFHLFENFSAVYDYSSNIAKHIQQALAKSIEISKDSSNLSEQILMMSIPVLTNFGIKLKAGTNSSSRKNTVLSAIDNYTPISSVTQRLAEKLSFDQLLDELRGLERTGAIYPIFSKIPFLVQQFRNGRAFKLKDYLLQSKLLSMEQLDEMIFSMQNVKGSQRLSLGALCVAKGLISARQLEIALQDQAFFGQRPDKDKNKFRFEADQGTRLQSLVGNLATTDPSGVLQNLASNRCHGVLSVEFKDLTFRALFEQGKLAFAKAGRLKGDKAVLEFVSVWKEGIFVFIERDAPPDLANDKCTVTKPLDKLLLDSALAADKIDAVWNSLEKGVSSLLERLPDENNLLQRTDLADPQENFPLSLQEMQDMQAIWSGCDGISSIKELIKRSNRLSTVQGALAVSRLIHYQLAHIPSAELQGPLDKFRSLVSSITEKIGLEKSETLLRISLRESQGYSAVARIFIIGTACEIGADLAAAKAAGLSLSKIVKALEDWQVKYIEHLSHELDKKTLRDIVYKIHR